MRINHIDPSALHPRAQLTVEDILKPTSPNLYFTPGVSRLLAQQAAPAPARTYDFARPVDLHAATLPIARMALSDPRTKLAFEASGILTDAGGKLLSIDHPEVSAILQGVNVFVGAYGCIDRLMRPEKYSRWRRAFCVAEWIISGLTFAGNFVPMLKEASTALLCIKVVVKVGDKIAEYNYTAREQHGRALLNALQTSPWLST